MDTRETVDRMLLRMYVLFRLLSLMMRAVSFGVISGAFCYRNLRTVGIINVIIFPIFMHVGSGLLQFL
jgi:hypothetical protein